MHRADPACSCERPSLREVPTEAPQTEISSLFAATTDSVASGTTDDTGIECSSLGACSVPGAIGVSKCDVINGQQCELRNSKTEGRCNIFDKPLPMVPETGRPMPPLPPKYNHLRSQFPSNQRSFMLTSAVNFDERARLPHSPFFPSGTPIFSDAPHCSVSKSGVNASKINWPTKESSRSARRSQISSSNIQHNPKFSSLQQRSVSSRETSLLDQFKDIDSKVGPCVSQQTCSTHDVQSSRLQSTNKLMCSQYPKNATHNDNILVPVKCFCHLNRESNAGRATRVTTSVHTADVRTTVNGILSTSNMLNTVAKPGCGHLRWVSQTFSRLFKTGGHQHANHSSKSATNVTEGNNCLSGSPNSKRIRHRSRITSNLCGGSLFQKRPKSQNPRISDSLVHYQQQSFINPDPDISSPSSCRSLPALKTVTMSVNNQHTLPPATPISLDPDIISELLKNNNDDHLSSPIFSDQATSGRMHPLPPSRTSNTPPSPRCKLIKHGLSNFRSRFPGKELHPSNLTSRCFHSAQLPCLDAALSNKERTTLRSGACDHSSVYGCSSSPTRTTSCFIPSTTCDTSSINTLCTFTTSTVPTSTTNSRPMRACSCPISGLSTHSQCSSPVCQASNGNNLDNRLLCVTTKGDTVVAEVGKGSTTDREHIPRQIHHIHHVHHFHHHHHHHHHHQQQQQEQTQSKRGTGGGIDEVDVHHGDHVVCSNALPLVGSNHTYSAYDIGSSTKHRSSPASSLSPLRSERFTNCSRSSCYSCPQSPAPGTMATALHPIFESGHGDHGGTCSTTLRSLHHGSAVHLPQIIPPLQSLVSTSTITTLTRSCSPIVYTQELDCTDTGVLVRPLRCPSKRTLNMDSIRIARSSGTGSAVVTVNGAASISSSMSPSHNCDSLLHSHSTVSETITACGSNHPVQTTACVSRPIGSRSGVPLSFADSTVDHQPTMLTTRIDNSSPLISSRRLPSSCSSFQQSMLELRKMGWYWGPLTFQQAQFLLSKRPDGTFLVRDSGHDIYILSLSFRVRGETYHTRIEHSHGRFSFLSQPQSHSASTMVEFIEKAVAHSISGQFHYFLQNSAPGQPPVEVPLLYPLSRFQVVPSLRHLARFTILSLIRRDHIESLRLPGRIVNYLQEKQYFAESLEDFVGATKDRAPLEFLSRAAQMMLATNGLLQRRISQVSVACVVPMDPDCNSGRLTSHPPVNDLSSSRHENSSSMASNDGDSTNAVTNCSFDS